MEILSKNFKHWSLIMGVNALLELDENDLDGMYLSQGLNVILRAWNPLCFL
jgi:hypothetical protein